MADPSPGQAGIELPEIVRLFPLPNVVLFPHVDLPLHIFEPRYREMVADALAGDGLIGMALLRGDWQQQYGASPEIYPVGCMGKIVTSRHLPDGRYSLILRGLARFEIVEEVLSEKLYRTARVRWLGSGSELEKRPAPALLDRLHRALKTLSRPEETATASGPEEDLEASLGALFERNPPEIVNILAFALDLSMVEKLALLQCEDLTQRADQLAKLLEFRVVEQRFSGKVSAEGKPTGLH